MDASSRTRYKCSGKPAFPVGRAIASGHKMHRIEQRDWYTATCDSVIEIFAYAGKEVKLDITNTGILLVIL